MVRTIRVAVLLFLLTSILAGCQKSSAAVREFQVQALDVSLHVRMAGDPDSGCVLIAINGGPGLTSNYMRDVESLAGPDCAVLTYDQRGLGKSTQLTHPDSTTSYTLLKYAEDVEAIRQAVGAERLHVMGHSWGGIVAMQYAILYPERVASLIFFGGGPPTWNDIEISQQRLSGRVEALMQAGVIPPPSEWGDKGIDPLLPAYFSDPTFTFPQDARGGAPEFSQAVSDLTSPNLVGMDLRGELALVQKPVLLMFGRDDPFGLPMAEATRDALVNAQVDFVVIDRCGHFWHECPDEFYPRVQELLQRPSGAPEPLPQDPTPMVANQAYLDVFETVWQTVNDTYFDPKFDGLDWRAEHDRYEPLIARAEDDQAFYHLLNEMLWKLNVSHTGAVPADRWQSVEPVVAAEGTSGLELRLLGSEAVITRVEPGSSGEKAGLRSGYVLESIDGIAIEQILAEAETDLSPPYNERGRIDGLTRSILSRVYGPADTCVTLSYLDGRSEQHQECVMRIRREREATLPGVPLPPSFLEFEAKRLTGDIGYIRFNTFNPALIPDMESALDAMRDAPGIVIDLRGNPGGYLPAGQALAAQFLKEQANLGAFKTRDDAGDLIVEPAEETYEGPVIILIDTLSYSASEWFASGMQAIGRAVIIGEQSPGGVTGANVKVLPSGAILIHPVLQLTAPDGTVLEGRGVIPDIQVELDRALLLQGIDSQLEAAIKYIEGVIHGD